MPDYSYANKDPLDVSDPHGLDGSAAQCGQQGYTNDPVQHARCNVPVQHARCNVAALNYQRDARNYEFAADQVGLGPNQSLAGRAIAVAGLLPVVGWLGRGVELGADVARGVMAATDVAETGGAIEGPLLLSAGQPQSLAVNALLPHEEAFAREILSLRGGQFVGVPAKSFPGIDGWLDGVPASLKEVSGESPVSILSEASRAERQGRKFGYSDVELFIKATNVNTDSLLDFIPKGPLAQIPNQGTIAAINIRTADDWIRIVGGGITQAGG